MHLVDEDSGALAKVLPPGTDMRKVDGFIRAHLCGLAATLPVLSDREDSNEIRQSATIAHSTPIMAFQNWKGATVAVNRQSFAPSGGFDGSFVNWADEDNELYDRLAGLSHCNSVCLRFVHLWHPPRLQCYTATRENANRLPEQLRLNRDSQLAALRQRAQGAVDRPCLEHAS